MAGHSKFKNIQHRKGAQDKKRANLFTKLAREIQISARLGGADIKSNFRLRTAIATARSYNMPKSKIDDAIAKATDTKNKASFEEVRYEASGDNQTFAMIIALTDNRNRTISDVKKILSKNGWSIKEAGSIAFMFQKAGLIYYEKEISDYDTMFEGVIQAGGTDCDLISDGYEIACPPESLVAVAEALEKKFGKPGEMLNTFIPVSKILVGEEKLTQLDNLKDLLLELDDVTQVIFNTGT